jgi:hypothetical protein
MPQYIKKPIPVTANQMEEEFEVNTLEGTMKGKAGDYLVTGIRGEQYPCDKEIFEESYIKFDDNFAEEYEKALKEMYGNPLDPIENW